MSATHPFLRRCQLSDFLKGCRARTAPQSVGLRPADRRRSKGLRREDVAALAGLSTTWYTWFEQGRDIHPSAEVLERLSATFHLSPAEREYLFLLAQCRPPPLAPLQNELIRPAVARMLETIALPALVLNPCWDILAWSPAWRSCFPDFATRAPADRNLLKILLTDSDFQRDPAEFESMARRVLAKARLDFSQWPHHPRWGGLVDEMNAASPVFRRLWRTTEIVGSDEGLYTETYPPFGEATFEHTTYTIEGEQGLRLLLISPLGEESRRVYACLLDREHARQRQR